MARLIPIVYNAIQKAIPSCKLSKKAILCAYLFAVLAIIKIILNTLAKNAIRIVLNVQHGEMKVFVNRVVMDITSWKNIVPAMSRNQQTLIKNINFLSFFLF